MKRGAPESPKVTRLMRLLNVERYTAVGILEMLWHFCAKFTPQGDIGRYSDAEIAEYVGWRVRSGSRGVQGEVRLRSALVQAGFLDECPCHRVVVHDWNQHADQSVRKFLSRHGLDFVHIISSPASSQQPAASSQSQQPQKQPAAAAAAASPPASPPENETPTNGTGDWLQRIVAEASKGMDLPPEYTQTAYGRRERNPQLVRIGKIIEDRREKIRESRKPVAYVRSLIKSELGSG